MPRSDDNECAKRLAAALQNVDGMMNVRPVAGVYDDMLDVCQQAKSLVDASHQRLVELGIPEEEEMATEVDASPGLEVRMLQLHDDSSFSTGPTDSSMHLTRKPNASSVPAWFRYGPRLLRQRNAPNFMANFWRKMWEKVECFLHTALYLTGMKQLKVDKRRGGKLFCTM